MLEIRRLRLLRELHVRGTISATAEAMYLSAPAVSQQLAKLETEVGVKLIERVGRGVRLTDAGVLLVSHTEALIARMELAVAELEGGASNLRGALHMTTFQTVATTLLGPALTTLTGHHPQLHVRVSEVEPDVATRNLILGEVDLVLADEYVHRPCPRHPLVDREELCHDPLRLVLPAAHPLAAAGKPVALTSLTREVWAVGLAGSAYAETVIAACNELGGFDPDVRHHATDPLIILALVRAGQGIALLPDLLRAKDDPSVAVRAIAQTSLHRRIFTATRASASGRPAIIELRAALKQAVSDQRINPGQL